MIVLDFGLVCTIKLGNIRIVLQLNNVFFSRCRAVLSTGYAKSDGFDGFALSSCDTAGIWLCSDGLDCVCKCFLVLFSLECEPWRPRWKINTWLASLGHLRRPSATRWMTKQTLVCLSASLPVTLIGKKNHKWDLKSTWKFETHFTSVMWCVFHWNWIYGEFR